MPALPDADPNPFNFEEFHSKVGNPKLAGGKFDPRKINQLELYWSLPPIPEPPSGKLRDYLEGLDDLELGRCVVEISAARRGLPQRVLSEKVALRSTGTYRDIYRVLHDHHNFRKEGDYPLARRIFGAARLFLGFDIEPAIEDRELLEGIVGCYQQMYSPGSESVEEIKRVASQASSALASKILLHQVYLWMDEKGRAYREFESLLEKTAKKGALRLKKQLAKGGFSAKLVRTVYRIISSGSRTLPDLGSYSTPYELISAYKELAGDRTITEYMMENRPPTRIRFEEWLERSGVPFERVASYELVMNPLAIPRYRDFMAAYRVIHGRDAPSAMDYVTSSKDRHRMVRKLANKGFLSNINERLQLSLLGMVYRAIGRPEDDLLRDVFEYSALSARHACQP